MIKVSSSVDPTVTSLLQEHLSRKSKPYRDPLVHIAWEGAQAPSFWLPEPALSLYGLPPFQAMPLDYRQHLSCYEFIHLLQAGVWLETLFMERLSRSLQKAEGDLVYPIYHLHEIREEAGHSLMFFEMMRRSHLPLPPSPFPKLKLTNLVGRHTPFGHAGFWIAVLIGESVPDSINRFIRQHRDEVTRVAYDIATLHIIDEARHLAHARDRLKTLLIRLPRWQFPLITALTRKVLREFVNALFYPQPALYELAGFAPGREWAQAARDNPIRHQFVEDMLRPVLEMLGHSGFRLDRL
jgi:hypothetical protein